MFSTGSNSKLFPSSLYQNGWSTTSVRFLNNMSFTDYYFRVCSINTGGLPKKLSHRLAAQSQLIMIMALNRSWCFDHELGNKQQVVIHSKVSLTRLEVDPKQTPKNALFGV